MANTKNYGLGGVGPDLELGKGGPRIKVGTNGVLELRDASNDLVKLTAAPATDATDVVVKSQLDALSGFDIALGDIAQGDGSWSPGAVPLDDTTKVSDAVDSLNEVLYLLIPKPPTAFPNASFTVPSVGSSPRLVSSFTDNTGGVSGLTAGATVTRIVTSAVTTNVFDDTGPGDTGTITARLNGAVIGSRVLTGSGDNGTYGVGLTISDQKDFPLTTPGFWKSIDVGVANISVSTGVNRLAITHSAAGTTPDLIFVRDTMTALGSFTSGAVTVSASGSFAYSSSVPHFDQGGSISVDMSLTNLAGQTYYGGSDPLTISGTNSVITSATYAYPALGITLPIAANTTSATPITSLVIPVDGNLHGSGVVQAVVRNVNGASSVLTVSPTIILVKRGVAATNRIDEMSIPVTGLGSLPNGNNAQRVGGFGATDNPVGTGTTFVPSGLLPAQEAVVAAGVLRHDLTNYSVGYVPAGPDFSARASGNGQYFTFSFSRQAVSTFKIVVNGTYASVWVKLPGISDNSSISPNGASANGWWNATQLYDGIGVPGKTGDTLRGAALGTVMNGSSGTFTITFGTASSTDATNNTILVRFRLNAGQSINSISITN